MGTVKVEHQKKFGSASFYLHLTSGFQRKAYVRPGVAASTILLGLNIADVECAKRSDLYVDGGDDEEKS
jgi:hypothetical protein